MAPKSVILNDLERRNGRFVQASHDSPSQISYQPITWVNQCFYLYTYSCCPVAVA